MSRRRIKQFNQNAEHEKPVHKEEIQPKAARIFGKYHARKMYHRLAAAEIPALGVWACGRAGFGGEFMTSYGADIGGPFGVYMLGRTIYFLREWSDLENAPLPAEGLLRPISNSAEKRGASAAGLFAFCTLTEIAQYFHIMGGTFDPKDILAFGAGITLALLVEKAVEPKQAKEQ
jgi:hypothetical protein